MPRYHFITEDGALIPDPHGTDLPDVAAAKRHGARLCGQILQDTPEEVWEDGSLNLTITDDVGLIQCQMVVITIDAPTLRKPTE